MNASGRTECTLLRWAPSRDSAAAAVSLLAMTATYAVMGANPENMGLWAFLGLVIVPVLAVGIPVYWVTRVERQPISSLGLTTQGWLPSLGLSLILCLITFYQLFFKAPAISSRDLWLPMAVAGALSLFEPLFVFGWLQLRFEKDFGVLPGILLAAFGFGIYHILYTPGSFAGQFNDAIMFAVFFRLTGNLLVVWPLLWGATSAWYCIGGSGCFYSWPMVVPTVVTLLIEVAYIAFMASRQRRREATSVHAHAA